MRVSRGSGCRNPFVALTVAVLCLFGAEAATAQDSADVARVFYVDVTYSGPQDGSCAYPFASIAEALSQTMDGHGDTVVVRAGVYDEILLVGPGTTLRSEEGAFHTAIVGDPSESNDLVGLGEGAALRGFSVGETFGAAVRVLVDSHAEVVNCIFYGSAVGVAVGSGGVLDAANNTFYMNLTGVSGETNAIVTPLRNNIFARNGVGVSASNGALVESGYNVFYDNGKAYEGALPGDSDLVRNPLFVDGAAMNLHLRATSTLRDAGDPEAGYADADGSRNDMGVDGGPYGVPDILAPQVFVFTNPSPPVVAQYGSIFFDATASLDDWGIASWEWDFDARDGLAFARASGQESHFYLSPGGYVVTLRLTDHSGFQGQVQIDVQVGDALKVFPTATPDIGAAPLTVQFVADVAWEKPHLLIYAWDFDGDGMADSTEDAPDFTFPAGTEPGLYQISVTVTNADGVSTQRYVPVTVTGFVPDDWQTLSSGQAGQLAVDAVTATLPANALNQGMPVALSVLNQDDVPFLPDGGLIEVLDLAPSGISLAESVTVRVALDQSIADPADVLVAYFDSASQTWFTDGISRIRVADSPTPTVSFDTAHFSTFAVMERKKGTVDINCCCADAAKRLPNSEDLFLASLTVLVLAGATFRFRRF